MKCLYCQKVLIGKQKKFCCTQHQFKYRNDNTDTNKIRRIKSVSSKIDYIKKFGGGCAICNYSKNLAVLNFHHRSSEHKVFQLSAHSFSSRKVEDIEEEIKKCDVLCARCHTEMHNARYNNWQNIDFVNFNINSKYKSGILMYERGIKNKIKFVLEKGGCCSNCGYNKNLAALEFNHLLPELKQHALTIGFLGYATNEQIINEMENVNLLCRNCHLEYHFPHFNNYEELKYVR